MKTGYTVTAISMRFYNGTTQPGIQPSTRWELLSYQLRGNVFFFVFLVFICTFLFIGLYRYGCPSYPEFLYYNKGLKGCIFVEVMFAA